MDHTPLSLKHHWVAGLGPLMIKRILLSGAGTDFVKPYIFLLQNLARIKTAAA